MILLLFEKWVVAILLFVVKTPLIYSTQPQFIQILESFFKLIFVCFLIAKSFKLLRNSLFQIFFFSTPKFHQSVKNSIKVTISEHQSIKSKKGIKVNKLSKSTKYQATISNLHNLQPLHSESKLPRKSLNSSIKVNEGSTVEA